MQENITRAIHAQTGIDFEKTTQVHGGDINHSYCLHGGGTRYFLKLNDALRYPDMLLLEAAGLEELRVQSSFKIPALIVAGNVDSFQYLMLEWIAEGPASQKGWEHFGRALADMHLTSQPYFGWQADNYIGSLQQTNTRQESWAAFYTNCRILPLVKILVDNKHLPTATIRIAESFCRQAGGMFPTERPSLLHGDLWSGNCMLTEAGQPCIYDPAVYYGHREMDIGMSRLFGGFNQRFYDVYSSIYPLEKEWEARLPITQLYPILVHAILFGGHYIASASNILKQYA